MRRTLSLIISTALLLAFPVSVRTQQQSDTDRLVSLIKEVQTQQAQIADNQGKIETKLNDVGESLRVARIFSARSR
jgi:hypothetical protein